MSTFEDAHRLMTELLKREIIIPKLSYHCSDETGNVKLTAEDVTAPCKNLADHLHNNATQLSRLLNDMLSDVFEEFKIDIRESHQSNLQLQEVLDILDEDRHIHQKIQILDEYKEKFPLLEKSFEALKRLSALSQETEYLLDAISYSKSSKPDVENAKETNQFFSNLTKDTSEMHRISIAVEYILDTDPSLKDWYFSTLDKTNSEALSTFCNDLQNLHQSLDVLCRKTDEKLQDYYWSFEKNFRRQRDGNRDEGFGRG